MNPIVSIIMGSTSDLPVMEKACKLLDEMQVPFEVNALSAHRTPEEVENFARNAKVRGIRVIIALLPAPHCLLLVSLSRECSTDLTLCSALSRCPQASLSPLLV